MMVKAKAPTVFEIVLPVDKAGADDQLIRHLTSPGMWRAALTALYLRAGKYAPSNSVLTGASFGFCDDLGLQVPRAGATHFGFTPELKGRHEFIIYDSRALTDIHGVEDALSEAINVGPGDEVGHG